MQGVVTHKLQGGGTPVSRGYVWGRWCPDTFDDGIAVKGEEVHPEKLSQLCHTGRVCVKTAPCGVGEGGWTRGKGVVWDLVPLAGGSQLVGGRVLPSIIQETLTSKRH